MASERAKTLMGRIAVHSGLITMEQLAEATREQGSLGRRKNIGDIFVEKGFITPEELTQLVQLQKKIVARAHEKEAERRRALQTAQAERQQAHAGVVSQLLLPTTDGKGRCAVNEILLKTPALPNVIREANTSMLSSIIQSGKSMGMQSMDDALYALVEDKRITAQDAYQKATDKARFEALLHD